MKILSWNVNGLRSCMDKGLLDVIASAHYSVVLLQETRSRRIPGSLGPPSWHAFLNPADRPGYSGVLSLTRRPPLSVTHGIGERSLDREGRVTTLEFPGLFIMNAYFVNARPDLSRLGDKIAFDRALQQRVQLLSRTKPVVLCGDLNVAHEDRDLARPRANRGRAGFTMEERRWFSDFLASGFLDTFRLFTAAGGHYTWWSYRSNARERNIGWRVDYCLVSRSLRRRVRRASILDGVTGSDHAPVTLDLAD
jgi:exodeoxyribonuclease-3